MNKKRSALTLKRIETTGSKLHWALAKRNSSPPNKVVKQSFQFSRKFCFALNASSKVSITVVIDPEWVIFVIKAKKTEELLLS